MKRLFCQSCGLPLDSEETAGSNQNGGKNEDYCIYRYKDETFTEDVSMAEMIDISLKRVEEFYKADPGFNKQEAVEKMNSYFRN